MVERRINTLLYNFFLRHKIFAFIKSRENLMLLKKKVAYLKRKCQTIPQIREN